MPSCGGPVPVFVSYSHRDRKWLDQLLAELSGMENLRTWTDKAISAGEPWRERIERAVSESRLAILLVSDPFLASPFIREVELPLIREHQLLVFWIALRESAFDASWLCEIQAAHDVAKPLAYLRGERRRQVLGEIRTRLEQAVRELAHPDDAGAS